MTTSRTLELDPNGDVELILECPNAQTLQWGADGAPHHGLDGFEDQKPTNNGQKPTNKGQKLTKGKQRKAKRKSSWNFPVEAAAEEPAAEEPAAEEPAAEEPVVEEPVTEAPVPEELTPEEPTAGESASGPETHDGPETEFGMEHESSAKPTISSEEAVADELRVLVSSRHLCLASSTFRNMFGGFWQEGSSTAMEAREVRASEWDAPAFLIVLDIIHGQHTSVPSSVSLELLAKVAAIVDYYDCHDITEPFVDVWIRDLQSKSKLPSSYGKECMLWASISWVFLRVDILQKMAGLAVMGCQRPVQTMGLPLPDSLSREYMGSSYSNILRVPRSSFALMK